MSDQWVHLANPEVADELCNYRGCQAESLNHPEALFHMNTKPTRWRPRYRILGQLWSVVPLIKTFRQLDE